MERTENASIPHQAQNGNFRAVNDLNLTLEIWMQITHLQKNGDRRKSLTKVVLGYCVVTTPFFWGWSNFTSEKLGVLGWFGYFGDVVIQQTHPMDRLALCCRYSPDFKPQPTPSSSNGKIYIFDGVSLSCIRKNWLRT